jgi:acetyltransferase-like isoleucine patch superfamily enzyme
MADSTTSGVRDRLLAAAGRVSVIAAQRRNAVLTDLDWRVLPPVRARMLRDAGIDVGADVRVAGRPIVDLAPRSRVSIGDRVTLTSRPELTALGVSHPVILRTLREGASIAIGDDSGLSGTAICSALRVDIGARVLFGADVIVADTDFHPVDVVPRREEALPEPSPDDAIVIENDAFIGARAIVLRGVRVGAASVIGAGSVVTRDVPPGVVAAGNPCRVIRELR